MRGVPRRGDSALIVQELRLPRALVVAAAGVALGCCGVLLLGVTRDPLAGPELIGVPFRRRTGCCLSLRSAEGVICEGCGLRR